MSTITDKSSWPVITQEARMNKGPLIRVTHPDGHTTKMYEADAIAQGLIARPKAQPQAENKMAPAAANKTAALTEQSPTGAPLADADDLTTVPGIGLGIARSLVARGIKTFDQLRAASDLSFLSKKAQKAVEDWKAE